MADGSGDRISYLYISGASFSGSTLLAFLLNAHPRMMSVSETCGVIPHANIPEDAIESYVCSCGEPLLACPFYRDLERRIQAQGSTFDLRDWRTYFRVSRNRWLQALATRPLPSESLQRLRSRAIRLLPGVGSSIREIARRNVHFARASLEIAGAEVYVDAQKAPARVPFLAAIPEFDLRVLHLVRDIRGGASSFMKHYPEKNDAAKAATAWCRANLAAARSLRSVSADRRMVLRYDQFCADPEGQLGRIADFVGVDRAAMPRDFRDSEHHIVGNQMRVGSSAEIRKDESWKARLTADDLEIIRRVGGAANRRFGFEWPTEGGAATCAEPTRS